MTEIQISVEADNSNLQDILEHVVREITDGVYRTNEAEQNRKVDLNWVYLENGKYQWLRNERS